MSPLRLRWVVLAALALFAYHAWWIIRFRRGLPLDIDEAAYAGRALWNVDSFRASGLSGLWHLWTAPSTTTPLVSASAVPMLLIFGRHLTMTMLVVPAFSVVLLFATYGIARRVMSDRLALVAAIAACAVPGVIDASRNSQFAIPGAALMSATLWAQLRSEGMRNRRWALLWGVLLGATVLSRTVMIAFVPGIILAATLGVLARDTDRRRGLTGMALGTCVAAALALSWYIPDWKWATRYLTAYGYGKQSASYGVYSPPLSLDYWTRRLSGFIRGNVYLPLTVVIGCCALVGLTLAWRAIRSGDGPSRALLQIARHPAFGLIVVLVEGYLALTTTRNQGLGYDIPLYPILMVVVVFVIAHTPRSTARIALVAPLLVVSIGNLLMKADVIRPLSDIHSVSVPGLGWTYITDGRGWLYSHVDGWGYTVVDPTGRLPSMHTRWLPAAVELVDWMYRYSAERGRQPVVCFASRDPLFNVNTATLAARLQLRRSLPVCQFDPDEWGGDSVSIYRDALSDPARGQPNFLITADRAPGEFDPVVTQEYAERAALDAGFRLVDTLRLPDGRETRVWWLERGPTDKDHRP